MVASVVTTFENNGLDGWSMVGLSTLEWRPEGGNPGAYAHWTDDPNGDYAYYVASSTATSPPTTAARSATTSRIPVPISPLQTSSSPAAV